MHGEIAEQLLLEDWWKHLNCSLENLWSAVLFKCSLRTCFQWQPPCWHMFLSIFWHTHVHKTPYIEEIQICTELAQETHLNKQKKKLYQKIILSACIYCEICLSPWETVRLNWKPWVTQQNWETKEVCLHFHAWRSVELRKEWQQWKGWGNLGRYQVWLNSIHQVKPWWYWYIML